MSFYEYGTRMRSSIPEEATILYRFAAHRRRKILSNTWVFDSSAYVTPKWILVEHRSVFSWPLLNTKVCSTGPCRTQMCVCITSEHGNLDPIQPLAESVATLSLLPMLFHNDGFLTKEQEPKALVTARV